MSRHSSDQAELPYPADDSRYNDLIGYRQALSVADLDGQANDAGHSHARLSVWEKDMCQIQAQEALSGATTENETEAISRRKRTLSDEAGRRRRLLVSRMANDAAANGMNFLQHGAVGPQTRLNYAPSLLKFERWLEQREEKS